MSTPDFKAAASRHHRDAQFLLDDQRWPNADHLAGVAAECGLKAILLGCSLARPDARDIPVWGTNDKKLGHVNQFWGELSQVVSGRYAPIFAPLLGGPPPFAAWDISDRYGDGNAINEQRVKGHLAMATKIIGVLEQARLSGVIP